MIYADSTDPGLALGYQFLPDLPVGFTLSTYDALWGLGMEGTLSAGGSRSHGQSTDRFSLSLGLNTPTPIDGLYPSLAISASHTRTEQGAHTIEMRTDWGVDAKLTAFAYSLVGMTVGYRAPFRDSPWRFGDPRPVDRPPISCTAAGVTPVSVTGRWMSTKTYGHLHEDDRAWFIADSFKWLVEHDRGEPMRAQKAHECYACGRAIPAGEQYRRFARRGRPDQREGPRGVLPEAPPGDAGLSLGGAGPGATKTQDPVGFKNIELRQGSTSEISLVNTFSGSELTYSAASDRPSVATVAVDNDKDTLTATAIGPGTAKITVTAKKLSRQRQPDLYCHRAQANGTRPGPGGDSGYSVS